MRTRVCMPQLYIIYFYTHTHTIKHVKNHCNSTQFHERGGGSLHRCMPSVISRDTGPACKAHQPIKFSVKINGEAMVGWICHVRCRLLHPVPVREIFHWNLISLPFNQRCVYRFVISNLFMSGFPSQFLILRTKLLAIMTVSWTALIGCSCHVIPPVNVFTGISFMSPFSENGKPFSS